MSRNGTLCWVLLFVAACQTSELPPEGEVILHVTTDAPLPRSAGGTLERRLLDGPAPLFDRLRVDIYRRGQQTPCVGCTRSYEIDHETVEGAGVSLSVLTGDAGGVARLRLFWSGAELGVEPHPDGTIEAWVELPPFRDEVVHRWILLPTDAIARPIGSLATPVSPSPGEPPKGLVGSWPHAARVDCASPPERGEVCVPGGAFWMGNPRAEGSLTYGVTRQRLVVLSPFYLSSTEVTVADFRASGVAGLFDPVVADEDPAFVDADWCSFTTSPGSSETLPVNCVTWQRAREYCKQQGGDLPTEAQLEYAAGGLKSSLYVWGMDEPGCQDAVFGRGAIISRIILTEYPALCDLDGGIGGPLPVDRVSHGRDVLELPSGSVFDLAGNLGEFARDGWAEYGSACWGSGVFFDPECASEGADLLTVKSGSWVGEAELLRAARRRWLDRYGFGTEVGFRCARPAEAAQ